MLKDVSRKGWISQVGIGNPESVADHSFGCAILAMFLGDLKGLDAKKLICLALLHDFHEALIGDYDIFDKQNLGAYQVKKNQKFAIKEVFVDLPKSIQEEYRCLVEEYFNQETLEAQLVKQIDKLEMALQAFNYEKKGYSSEKLDVFWDSVESSITDPDLRLIYESLKNNRKKNT